MPSAFQSAAAGPSRRTVTVGTANDRSGCPLNGRCGSCVFSEMLTTTSRSLLHKDPMPVGFTQQMLADNEFFRFAS